MRNKFKASYIFPIALDVVLLGLAARTITRRVQRLKRHL